MDAKWFTLQEAIKEHVPAEDSGKNIIWANFKINLETYFCILFIFNKFHILTPGSEDEVEEYIEEDWETETKCTQKAAHHIQQNILQELRTVVGGAQTLPETAAKDLILQVMVL